MKTSTKDKNIIRRAIIKELDAINDYEDAEQSLSASGVIPVIEHINKEEKEHVEELSKALKQIKGNPARQDKVYYQGAYGIAGWKEAESPEQLVKESREDPRLIRGGVELYAIKRRNPERDEETEILMKSIGIPYDYKGGRYGGPTKPFKYLDPGFQSLLYGPRLMKVALKRDLHKIGSASMNNPKKRKNPQYQHYTNYKGFEIERVTGDWLGMRYPGSYGMKLVTYRIIDPSGRPLQGLFESPTKAKMQIDFLTSDVPNEIWEQITGSGVRKKKK